MTKKSFFMKKIHHKIMLPSLAFILMACQSVPKDPTDMKQALDQTLAEMNTVNEPKALTQVPNAVQQELMFDDINRAKQGLLAEKRLEIAATQVSAKDFFQAIVEGSRYNIIIHPDVSGEITLNLNNVTLDEALSAVEDVYGYDVSRLGNTVRVFPAGNAFHPTS
jgi:MSHA biogenesis protein MshL